MKKMMMPMESMSKRKPGLSVRFDEWGDMGEDKEYRKRELKRLKDKKKSIKDAITNFDPEEHAAKAKRVLQDELRKCEMQMMDYDTDEDKE